MPTFSNATPANTSATKAIAFFGPAIDSECNGLPWTQSARFCHIMTKQEYRWVDRLRAHEGRRTGSGD